MNNLIEKFRRKIGEIQTDSVRSIMYSIHWKSRLIGLKGARGVGKTTLLLQHIKVHYHDTLDTVLYVSLDDLWFSEHSLIELADSFVKKGGKRLYLDEVHKYPKWSSAIKNIYDDYSDLQIVFTGSSLLEILNARADLSRRAVVYTLQGLSLREYLRIREEREFPPISLSSIFQNHESVSEEIIKSIKPLKHFGDYINGGYYPFFLEGEETYGMKLEETILMLLEVELPLLRKIEISHIVKLKQLLYIIAESAPFIPNISRLSDRIGINRQTLLGYLHNLEEAKLIHILFKKSRGLSALQKPDKIYLENTNLMYLFQGAKADRGNLRETFFVNQLQCDHKIHYTEQGDFLIDGTYTIEVGGKNKTGKQIRGIENSFIAADNLEFGHGNTIPLWLFGFLY